MLAPWAAIVWLALTCAALRASPPASDSERPAIGGTPREFAFTDIHFLPRRLAELGEAKATVVVFTTLDCPLVRRYLPRLKSLDEAYREQGVRFLALNIGVDDALLEVAQQALEADLAFPVGKDFDGSAARALGATRTPEAIVLDAERRIVYRGRIDGQFRLTGVRPEGAPEELRDALDDLLAGRAVRVAETPADGCLIELDALDELPARVPAEVTYSEHIAPLLARHCQDCHRPGASAPFTLLDYRDARAHAEMIGEVVRQQRMPPAYASSAHGAIENRRGLTAEERALVLAWARRGKPEGDPAKLPAPRVFAESKWRIGEPDLVVAPLFATQVPAEGDVPYKYVVLPHVFLHDTWIEAAEILPGDPAVVHHCNLGFASVSGINDTQNFITGYVPGGDPLVLGEGVGFLIPAGSALVLQIHYVTTGAKATDRTSVGLRYSRGRVDKQLRHFQGVVHRFEIPPGAPHYRMRAVRTLPCNATGVGMFSHMHLRGKDMAFRATYPDGREETLLSIPNYDFNWQLAYRWAPGRQKFPKGTRVEVVAHFDNSSFNPFNPDPGATVREGQQTRDEMMYGFLFYTDDDERLGLEIDPQTGRPSS